jgi:CHAT domain-containing protein
LRIPLFLNFTETISPDKRKKFITQSAHGTGGGGAVSIVDQPVDWTQVSKAFDTKYGTPPPFPEHEKKGLDLANLVLAEGIRLGIQANAALPWEILHDRACSAIPFEMLAFQDASGAVYHPALKVGICRRLGSKDAAAAPNYSQKTRYRLLIVADTRDDLPGARTEAKVIKETLEKEFGPKSVPTFEIRSLIGSREATIEAVLDEIGTGQYDFIHYAGHGNHDADPKKSGLRFKNGYLTAEDLKEAIIQRRQARRQAAAKEGRPDSGHPPALVILNACLVGNLIPKLGNQAFNQATLAEAILSTGIGGFIGNRWLVNDQAAALFSSTVYASLARSVPLGDAVREARNVLHGKGEADWANYALYGTREIKL